MFELHEIEELFKSEDLAKNKAMVHALLRNAALLHREGISDEEKATALENIKAITHGKQQKVKKPKEAVVAPAAAAPVKPAVPGKLPFHEEFTQHHGGDPVKFKASFDAMSPDQKKMTMNWHQEQLSAKVAKSVDNLYSLIAQLKKHL